MIGLISATAAGSAGRARPASARPCRTRVLLGDRVSGPGVVRAVGAPLGGEPVALKAELAWPLPALLPLPLPALVPLSALRLLSAVAPLSSLTPEGAYSIRVNDSAVGPAEREIVLRPPSLVVGVGVSKGAPVDEVLGLVEDALRDAGLSVQAVAELATVDAKAAEPAILGAAERLGVPVVTYSAEELAEVDVPNPSDAPLAAVGTPSVAEAAALARGGELLVPKRKSAARPARATCAVVRRAVCGQPAGVGLGPGPGRGPVARDLLAPRDGRTQPGHPPPGSRSDDGGQDDGGQDDDSGDRGQHGNP